VRTRRVIGITIASAIAATCLTAHVAFASTGIRTQFWSGSAMTLSTTVNNSSNATALWQTLAHSNGECLSVNGLFGVSVRNATVNVQNGYGVPATGVVDSGTWNAVQFAIDYYDNNGNPVYRHRATGYVDAYADQYWKYYGGGSIEAKMAWNVFVPQWYLNPYPLTSGATGWVLIAASANRTITSFPCNA
jgi:peptidoglycan hydrolase-like protein with peptidoglycan-binding domain